jgi:PAS domain S-box-containing protein
MAISSVSPADLSRIFAATPNPYLLLRADPPRFTIVAVNEAYLRATGTTREAMLGRGLFEVFPDNPEDATASGVSDLRSSLDRVLRDKAPDAMGVQKYDIPFRDGSGRFEVKYWSPINTPVEDADGQVDYIIHRVEDVTEFMLAREREDAKHAWRIETVEAKAERMEAEVLRGGAELKSANRELKQVLERLAEANAELKEIDRIKTDRLQAMNDQLAVETAERRKSHELLQAVTENTPAVIYVKDLDGRYLMLNRRFGEIFHVDPAAMIGKTDYDVFTEAQANAFRAMDERVARADRALTEEEQAPQDDGVHSYISVKAPLRDDNGQVHAVFGISTDITDLKRAQEALVESEERARLIVESALDAVIGIDSSGAVVDWSEQAAKTFGWMREEVLGRPLADIIIPERYRASHRSGLARYLAVGEAHVLNRRIEISALHRDGHEFPVELSITAIRSGGTVTFSGFARDITDRKMAEASLKTQIERMSELARAEAKFRLAMEAARMGEIIVDLKTEGAIHTPAFAKLFGYPADRRLSLAEIMERWHPEDRARVIAERDTAILGGASAFETEYRIVWPDGTTKWLSGRGQITRDASGAATEVSVIYMDVTERKWVEERQNLLLAELNHRVKNTLASIQSIALQSRLDRPTPEVFGERFEARLGALASAHDLLTQAAWEGASLADAVRRTLAPHMKSGNGADRITIDGPAVQLSPNAAVTLHMALHELATNAAKYGALSAPHGRLQVRWSVDRSATPATIEFVWTESGGPVVQPPKRRGFGLHLVEKGLAHELEGAVSMQFEPGGLTYQVRLPASAKVAPL